MKILVSQDVLTSSLDKKEHSLALTSFITGQRAVDISRETTVLEACTYAYITVSFWGTSARGVFTY